MKKQSTFQGEWQCGNEKINMSLPMIEFEEDGSTIIYCPALDVSGYGNGLKEANESFAICLSEFFHYSLNKKTLFDYLKSLGWVVKNKHKKMQAPTLSKLLEENENFNRIFNNFPLKKYDKQIEIPVC
jgi:hypothetical protein